MKSRKIIKKKRTIAVSKSDRTAEIDLLIFIRDPDIVWYGPHPCVYCGVTIVRSSFSSGGVELDAPHGHHYPNHVWVKHTCVKTTGAHSEARAIAKDTDSMMLTPTVGSNPSNPARPAEDDFLVLTRDSRTWVDRVGDFLFRVIFAGFDGVAWTTDRIHAWLAWMRTP